MLKIQCAKCGATLKGLDVIITPIKTYIDNVKYQDFNVVCSKCGGVVVHERYAKMAAENKAKAIAKLACKKGKTIKQITEEEKYNIIMRKASKHAKKIAASYKENPVVTRKDLRKAITELPQDEMDIVLAYEDKLDLEMLKKGTDKPTAHIKPNSILLLTQAIIESAIAEKDEEFFQSKYGEQVVDTYNTALTIHTNNDYGITADFLLEKMRKNAIRVKGEHDND